MSLRRNLIGGHVVRNKRVAQQLSSRQSLGRIPLQTTGDEVPQLLGRRGRCFRWMRHANCAHETSPITWLCHRKRKPTQIELQNADPKAPDISGVAIVLAVIDISIDSLRTHVGNSSNRRVTRIHCLC